MWVFVGDGSTCPFLRRKFACVESETATWRHGPGLANLVESQPGSLGAGRVAFTSPTRSMDTPLAQSSPSVWWTLSMS
jgi:hypothetical protein